MATRFAAIMSGQFKVRKSLPKTLRQTPKSLIHSQWNNPITASLKSKFPKWPNKSPTTRANRGFQSCKIHRNLSVQLQKINRTNPLKKIRNSSGINKAQHRSIGKNTQSIRMRELGQGQVKWGKSRLILNLSRGSKYLKGHLSVLKTIPRTSPTSWLIPMKSSV